MTALPADRSATTEEPELPAMTPVMTYLVLPQLTRRLDWWLRGRPAPWRR